MNKKKAPAPLFGAGASRMSPLGDDLAVDLFLAEVVPLDRHNDLNVP